MVWPHGSPGKPCTFPRTGLPLGWYWRPPFLNCPTYEVGRRARCQWCWTRPDDPLPNRTCSLSEHPALQRLLRGCRGWLPAVDRRVTAGADHEGLPASPGHELIPDGLRLTRSAEIGELSDMVDVHRARLPAQLAPPCHEPGDQLLAADGDRRRVAVGEGRGLLWPQLNATETG